MSMSKSWNSAAGFAGLVAALALSGCVTVETQSYRVQKDSAVESAQVATNADFSRYDRLLAEEAGIFFPDGARPSDEDIARIRQIFRTAFLAELEGYSIVSQPGPSTMSVQASIIDLRGAAPGQVPAMNRQVQDMARPGSLVFMMELRDSRTGAVLARAGDSTMSPAFSPSGGAGTTDWDTVEQAAKHWAALFRGFLDRNLGR